MLVFDLQRRVTCPSSQPGAELDHEEALHHLRPLVREPKQQIIEAMGRCRKFCTLRRLGESFRELTPPRSSPTIRIGSF